MHRLHGTAVPRWSAVNPFETQRGEIAVTASSITAGHFVSTTGEQPSPDVHPDVGGGPVPDRPVRGGAVAAGDDAVAAATSGVEMPAGGGLVGPHTPQLTGPEEFVGPTGGSGKQNLVQIDGRADRGAVVSVAGVGEHLQ